MLHVENLVSARSGREVPNQFRISDSNKVTFQSYDSMIATIDHNTKTILIGEYWDYSVTTAKYRNQFFDREGFRGLASRDGIKNAINEGKYAGYAVILA